MVATIDLRCDPRRVLNNLQSIEKGVGRAMATALMPAITEMAKRTRATYKARGIEMMHEPMRVTTQKSKATMKIRGGWIPEFGTGMHFVPPAAPRSRAKGKPYPIRARKAQVLLARGPVYGYTMWHSRGVMGRSALIAGMKPKPVVGLIVEEISGRIPELTGSDLMERFRGLTRLAG